MTKRGMERLKAKLIGGHEMMCDDRLTKVPETDVWWFISLSEAADTYRRV